MNSIKIWGALLLLSLTNISETKSQISELETKVQVLVNEYQLYLNYFLSNVKESNKEDIFNTSTEVIFYSQPDILDDINHEVKGFMNIQDYIANLKRLKKYEVNINLIKGSVLEVSPSKGQINLRAYVKKRVPKRNEIKDFEVQNTEDKKYVWGLVLTKNEGKIESIQIASIYQFEDSDKDNIDNIFDLCPSTSFENKAKVNTDGCTDLDGDGYYGDAPSNSDFYDKNENDACVPNIESTLCDSDRDGVPNDKDLCPNTTPTDKRFTNSDGCTDRDKDGYFADVDRNKTSKNSNRYDKNDNNPCIPNKDTRACDGDRDGVPDALDKCPCTDELSGNPTVDSKGCVDKDGDGYYPDACKKNSHRFDNNDSDRCKPSNKGGNCDIDGDGVINKKDKCKNTYAKTKSGCPKKEKTQKEFYPISKWSLDGHIGMTNPVGRYSENDFYALNTKTWKNENPAGFARSNVYSDISISFTPTQYFGFKLGIGYFSNKFNKEAFNSNLKIFLAEKGTLYESISTDVSNQQFLFPNFSILLGYFKVDNLINFEVEPSIGILSDYFFENELRTIIDYGSSLEVLDVSFDVPSEKVNPIFSLKFNIHFNINNKYLVGITTGYSWTNYKLSEQIIPINSQPESMIFKNRDISNLIFALNLKYNLKANEEDRSRKYRK